MKITGIEPRQGGAEPVRTKLQRAVDVARLVGAIFQAVYYGLKIW